MAKISEITIEDIKDYAKIDNVDEDTLITLILAGAKSYIKSYTGLDDTAVDTKEDLTIALFILAKEMYDNREYTVENDKVNPVVKSILDMHSINLL